MLGMEFSELFSLLGLVSKSLHRMSVKEGSSAKYIHYLAGQETAGLEVV